MSRASGESSNGSARTNGPTIGLDPRVFAEEMRRAQALGFRAATDIATSVLPYLYGDESSASTPPSAFVREFLSKGDQLADGLASVVRGVVAPLADYFEASRHGRTSDRSGDGIECVASGGQTATATATLVASVDVGPGRIWVTSLSHSSGACVEAERIRCIPAHFERLARGTSLPVRVVVGVPAEAVPGSYVGHLLCTGLPDEARSLRLEVVAESPGA